MKKHLDETTIKRMVDTYIKDTLDSLNHYIAALDAVSRDMAQGQLETIMELQSGKEEALFKRDYGVIRHVVKDLLHGQEIDKISHNKLSREVLRAAIDLDEIQIKALQGEPMPTTLDEPETAHQKGPVTSTMSNAGPEAPGPLLSEFVEIFPKTRTTWTPGTHREYNSTKKLVLKILGDIPVGTITKGMMTSFRETLLVVPAYWSTRHKTVEVNDLPVPGAERLKADTILKHLTFVGQIMDYATDKQYLLHSPMPSTSLSLPDDKTEARLFSDDQVKTILTATAGFDDHRYWLPLLGLYTGCRINELCQLHKEDLKEQDGIWHLDINDDGKKTLKNKPSKRLIPLHRAIIDLGFIEYAKGVNHHRLFPGLNYRENYSNNYSRVFGGMLVKIGLKKQGDASLKFHSFRHRMETSLKRLEINNEHIDQILGHKLSETRNQTYHHGYELKPLKADIDQLPDHRTL